MSINDTEGNKKDMTKTPDSKSDNSTGKNTEEKRTSEIPERGVDLLRKIAKTVTSNITWANPMTVVFLSVEYGSLTLPECKDLLIASRDRVTLSQVVGKKEVLDDVLKIAGQVVAKFGPVCYVEQSPHLPELQSLCHISAASMDAISKQVKERADVLKVEVSEALSRLSYIYEVIVRIALANLYGVAVDTTLIKDDQNPDSLFVSYFLVASKTGSFKNDEVLITKTPMKGNFGLFIEDHPLEKVEEACDEASI